MQRWTALVFVAGVVLVAVLVVLRVGPDARPLLAGSDRADAGAASSGAPQAGTPGPNPVLFQSGDPLDAGVEPPLVELDAGGLSLPNGDLAPPIAVDAPKQVTFGVILFEYRGAEGAARTARTREEALALATKTVEEAKTDFAAAVKKGDKGSTDNAGAIPRGILEPAPEFVLFGLAVGDIGGPVDTPRGYWVIKRID